MMCGGTGEDKPADDGIQKLIQSSTIKKHAQEKAGKTFEVYTAVSYKSQVVSGTNFFVKVDIGGDEFVHMRVFRPLPHVNSPPSLADIQVGKTKSDPIEHF